MPLWQGDQQINIVIFNKGNDAFVRIFTGDQMILWLQRCQYILKHTGFKNRMRLLCFFSTGIDYVQFGM